MKSILKDKKGLLLRNWIVIVVLIGMTLAASSYWIGAWEGKYAQIESSNLTSYNSIEEMASITHDMESKLGPGTEITQVGWLDFIVQGGYNILIAVLSVPTTIRNFVSDIGGQFGIPRIYIDGFIVLISVAAIFGVIGAIFRRKT